MNDTTNIANDLIARGLAIIPIRMPDKAPTIPWKEFQTRLPRPGELSFNGSIALICGKVSGGVEVIDVDVKNDPGLIERFQNAIDEHCPNILELMTAQKTISGGLHLIYKCSTIEGNLKLAQKANREVLIETRGEGGYIVCHPTEGYEITHGSLDTIQTISPEDRSMLLEACRSVNEYFEPVRAPQKENVSTSGLTPWDDYNERADIPALLESHGWKFVRASGESQLWRRPGKDIGHSASWNGKTFYCFTSSTGLEPGKAYSPAALYTFLEHAADFTKANAELYSLNYGERHRPAMNSYEPKELPGKHFKNYIIREEPTEEKGIISINGVNVLSSGNVLLLTGPMKGRKTMLACLLVNQCKLRTAYIDTEQGKKHSWRTGKFTPTADVFHLRGEDLQEITSVVNACVDSGEYQLIVLDNVRDLVLDFNDVKESGRLELFLKKISERVPVIAILHENKNSQSGQGHVGHGLGKISQTSIRVQLVDVEDPGKGSYVECVRSRDEPFKRAFISMEGVLSNDNLLKAGGKTMLQDEVFRMLGNTEYTYDEMIERISEIFGIMKSSAKNSFYSLKKACPNAISERKEGKKKFYFVSLPSK